MLNLHLECLKIRYYQTVQISQVYNAPHSKSLTKKITKKFVIMILIKFHFGVELLSWYFSECYNVTSQYKSGNIELCYKTFYKSFLFPIHQFISFYSSTYILNDLRFKFVHLYNKPFSVMPLFMHVKCDFYFLNHVLQISIKQSKIHVPRYMYIKISFIYSDNHDLKT